MALSRAWIIAPLLLAAGCNHKLEQGVYNIPLAEAYDRLAAADIDGFRLARQCGILIHFEQSGQKNEAVTWRVTSSGQPMLRFTVRLTALDPAKTRATIEVPPDPAGGEPYDGTKSYPRPAINQPLRPAVQELIDAAMADRPYDVERIPQPRNLDKVCSVQRSGLESGSLRFRVDDRPSMDATESARLREAERQDADRGTFDPAYGKPMDTGRGGQ